jgi:hypothetical protein
MSNPAPANLAQSVFQRLLNYAKENGEDFPAVFEETSDEYPTGSI